MCTCFHFSDKEHWMGIKSCCSLKFKRSESQLDLLPHQDERLLPEQSEVTIMRELFHWEGNEPPASAPFRLYRCLAPRQDCCLINIFHEICVILTISSDISAASDISEKHPVCICTCMHARVRVCARATTDNGDDSMGTSRNNI